jgi:hypothetical protein
MSKQPEPKPGHAVITRDMHHDGAPAIRLGAQTGQATYNYDEDDNEISQFQRGVHEPERKQRVQKDEEKKLSVTDGRQTLADIKRRAKEEKEDDAAEQTFTKIDVRNVTSEDTLVKTKKMYTFYCSICGAMAVVTDANIASQKKRKADDAFCYSETSNMLKKYTVSGPRVLVKRENGVEVQHRTQCKSCSQPIGYRSKPDGDKAPYTYFWKEALVLEQGMAAAMQA